MKMFMEKSWNMKNWPKAIDFCYQSCNFTNFAVTLCEICMFFVTTEKLSIRVESLHFLMFSANAANAKSKREMVMEKYFVNSVQTLHEKCILPGEIQWILKLPVRCKFSPSRVSLSCQVV